MTPLLFIACVTFTVFLIVSTMAIVTLVEAFRLDRQARRTLAQLERDPHAPTN